MKVAAVSGLKALLSECLAGVEALEAVVITGRGRPVARLVPVPAAGGPKRGIPGRAVAH